MRFDKSVTDVPSTVENLLAAIPLPRVAKVAQIYDRPRLDDIETTMRDVLVAKGCLAKLKPGQSVAITAGSRGITNIPTCIRTVARMVKEAGAIPFIVPAMGSHGGATAEGQIALLKGLGIDETMVEAPIKASMDTVIVGISEDGLPVHMDKYAAEADSVIAINRIKPHTSFRGEIESGVMKMLTIGLGKQKGADICHNLGFGHMAKNVPALANVILANKNILCGIGIIENALHETASLHVLEPEEILEKEKELLREAFRLAPKIFFDELDILVIDEIGKDISGTGFDSNVVGRYHNPHAWGGPVITRVLTLDITDKSKGNANGIGMCDFTTVRAFEKYDGNQTYPNALTSTIPLAVKMPMVLRSDERAIQAAIKTCNLEDKNTLRLVRIKNTNDMSTIHVSEALIPYCGKHPNLKVMETPQPFAFDNAGNLW